MFSLDKHEPTFNMKDLSRILKRSKYDIKHNLGIKFLGSLPKSDIIQLFRDHLKSQIQLNKIIDKLEGYHNNDY